MNCPSRSGPFTVVAAMAKNSSVSFLALEDIRDGMFVLKGGRYRAVIAANPVNFSLLSSEEQEAVEGAFGSMLMGLSFPLQILAFTRPVDIRDCIHDFKKNQAGFSPDLMTYCNEMEKFLLYFASRINITESYVIIPYDDLGKDCRRARGELMRRVQVVMEGLAKCNLVPRMLDTAELLQFMYGFFQKDSKILPYDLVQAGALELVKEGREKLENPLSKEATAGEA